MENIIAEDIGIDVPSDMGFVPTEQQVAIVKAALVEDRLKIDAAAGASKTSTLVMIAHNIHKPSLYIAFNKSMASEAREMFPEHVDVMTTHSLAYRHTGHLYKHK